MFSDRDSSFYILIFTLFLISAEAPTTIKYEDVPVDKEEKLILHKGSVICSHSNLMPDMIDLMTGLNKSIFNKSISSTTCFALMLVFALRNRVNTFHLLQLWSDGESHKTHMPNNFPWFLLWYIKVISHPPLMNVIRFPSERLIEILKPNFCACVWTFRFDAIVLQTIDQFIYFFYTFPVKN